MGEETSEPILVQKTHKYQVKFETKTLGMDVTKGRNSLWVAKVNMEILKKKIQINDTISVKNGERVGNDISALQSPNRPLYIEFSRTGSVEVIEDERIEYYSDEELMNSEGIPNETGIDNSDIELFDGNESTEPMEV